MSDQRYSLLQRLSAHVTTAIRISLAFVLFLMLFIAGIHYDKESDDRWPYPTSDYLAASHEPYIGERTLLFGTVREVDPAATSARLEVEHSTGTFLMTIRSFDTQVEPGGTVQVYGTLGPHYTISAERVVVVNAASTSKWYKYAVSVLGALLFLITFFRSWRIDLKALAFERRTNG